MGQRTLYEDFMLKTRKNASEWVARLEGYEIPLKWKFDTIEARIRYEVFPTESFGIGLQRDTGDLWALVDCNPAVWRRLIGVRKVSPALSGEEGVLAKNTPVRLHGATTAKGFIGKVPLVIPAWYETLHGFVLEEVRHDRVGQVLLIVLDDGSGRRQTFPYLPAPRPGTDDVATRPFQPKPVIAGTLTQPQPRGSWWQEVTRKLRKLLSA